MLHVASGMLHLACAPLLLYACTHACAVGCLLARILEPVALKPEHVSGLTKVCVFVCVYIYLSIICLSIYLYLSIYLSYAVYVCMYLSIYRSIYLCIRTRVYPPAALARGHIRVAQKEPFGERRERGPAGGD
jgi:hypothetical protein